MDLSIVIPAFNESRKIARDVEAAAQFLNTSGLTGEIIVVDDGSRDDTSHAAAKADPAPAKLKVVRYEPHRGKGCAVRTGVKASSGDYIMFADSGCCVPYTNALQGLQMLKDGSCQIAHGSRKLAASRIQRPQSRLRRACSYLFRRLADRLMHLPPGLTDTQCGFKLYKAGVARQLYAECLTDGFMFDIEIILRAQQHGYRIREFPVEWTCDPDSRLSVARTPWPVLRELAKIRRAVSKKRSFS